MCLSPTDCGQSEKQTKQTFKGATSMSWLQAAYYFSGTGDVQHHDGEANVNTYRYRDIQMYRQMYKYIYTGSTNGNHNCIVIPMYIAIIMLTAGFQDPAVSLF